MMTRINYKQNKGRCEHHKELMERNGKRAYIVHDTNDHYLEIKETDYEYYIQNVKGTE